MKFIIGEPLDNNFNPQNEEWNSVKKYGLIKYQLFALPIAFGLAILIDLIYSILSINIFHSYISFIYAALLIIPLHELSHSLLFPKSLISKDVLFGFYPKAFVFFTHYNGIITRNRFILILLAPFLILTVLPLIFIILTGNQNVFLAKMVFINALSSSIDLLTVIKTIKEIPKNGFIRNKGFKSYWKRDIHL